VSAPALVAALLSLARAVAPVPADGGPSTTSVAAVPGARDDDDDDGVGAAAARRRDDRDDRARRSRRAPKRAPARGPIEVPIDVGVGPVVPFGNPPVVNDQIVHTALALSIAAVIDDELIKRHQDKIPAGMRRLALGLGEVRYRPWFLALVPELLIVSPQVLPQQHTGMYGAVWRPLGAGLTLLDTPAARLSVNAAVDVAAGVVHSTALGVAPGASATSITVLLRPGLNLDASVEVPLSKTLLVSGGWSSDFFVPQPFGRPPWEVLPLDDSLWHLGGPYLKLHVRVPYVVDGL
jgi:hypothetical protein